MIREPIRFVLYGAITIAAVGVLACSGMVSFLDQHILLENLHPTYVQYLQNATVVKVPDEFVDHGVVNQIMNSLITTEYDQGFAITANKDGSITYTGTNQSENTVYISLTDGYWNLPSGSYVLSDSLNGVPMSTEDFRLYAQARNYYVGGVTQYHGVANMANLDETFFTTDYSQYNDYNVSIAISPGFSSDGITLYPMLTRYEDQTGVWHPCLRPYGYDETEMVSYDYYQMSKQEYLALSDEDRELLDRRIQYQAYNRWSTIDFGDGTGVEYPNNEVSRAIYGELNAIGRISLEYGGTSQIALVDLPLAETTSFVSYLQSLNNEDYTILIAVAGGGVNALTDYMMTLLEDLGVQTQLTLQDKNGRRQYQTFSYYAVLNPGSESVEAVDAGELNYSGMTRDGKASFELHSAGSGNENVGASILVDGIEQSLSKTGMNIVVYDNSVGEIIDAVTFNTDRGLRAYRQIGTLQE